MRSAQKVHVSRNIITGDASEHDQVGLLVSSPPADQGGPLSEVKLENNTISEIAGFGIQVHSGNAVHLAGNTVRGSAKENIHVAPEVTGLTQQGNKME